MKAIITGAGGFIGKRLCTSLLKRGWRVLGVGRHPRPSFFEGHPELEWLQRDLSTDTLSPKEVEGADVLFHLAGATGGKIGDELFFIRANELTALNSFRSCAGKVERIIHASSQVVYGDVNSLEVDEAFPLRGFDSAYACSKLNSENWLRRFHHASGGHAIALRFSGFVEGGGAVDHFLSQARLNEPIEVLSMGRVCRDYVALDDGIAAFLAAADIRYDKPTLEAYNVSSGSILSWFDMARFICNETASLSQILPVPKSALRSNLVLKIDKAREELGFSPTPLKDALRRYIHSTSAIHA